MTKRRNCCEVISDMLLEIPPSEKELISDLNWNFEDASYKAPEETLQWKRTMETLIKHIPKPSQEWEYKVLSVFTTKSVEELKSTTQ